MPPHGMNRDQMRQEAAQALREPPGEKLRESVGQALHLEVEPGASIILMNQHTHEVWLNIERLPGGEIRCRQPSMRKPIPITLSHRNTNRKAWNEIALQAIQRCRPLIARWAEQNLQIQDPQLQRGAVETTLRHLTQEPLRTIPDRIQEALEAMPDPEILRTAQRYSRTVTPSRYCVALMGESQFRELEQRCPGTITWAMESLRPRGPITQGAQVEDAFRETLAQSGLSPGAIRTAGQISRDFMRRLTRIDRKYGGITELLNATHQSLLNISGKPDSTHIRFIAQALAQRVQRDQGYYLVGRDAVEDELLRLQNPQAHREAARLGRPVRANAFMIALMGKERLQRMRRDSPGLLTWAMLRDQPDGPTRHPGEITARVRPKVLQEGLDPRAWRTFVNIPRPS